MGLVGFVWARPNSLCTADRLMSGVQGMSVIGADAHDGQIGLDPQGDAYGVWVRADLIQTRVRETDGTVSAVQDVTG
jgi:hypothetical protein